MPIELEVNPPDLIYDEESFPPGCVCSECRRPFEHGDHYSQRLLSVSGEVTLVDVVCLQCVLPGVGEPG